MPFIPGAFLAAGFFAAFALGIFAADMSFDSAIRNKECRWVIIMKRQFYIFKIIKNLLFHTTHKVNSVRCFHFPNKKYRNHLNKLMHTYSLRAKEKSTSLYKQQRKIRKRPKHLKILQKYVEFVNKNTKTFWLTWKRIKTLCVCCAFRLQRQIHTVENARTCNFQQWRTWAKCQNKPRVGERTSKTCKIGLGNGIKFNQIMHKQIVNKVYIIKCTINMQIIYF